jgi:nucleoside-diphosphate-sugar epimerase
MTRYKIGVVGGSGYVGSALALRFCRDFSVVIIDKKPVSEKLAGKVEYRSCDITNLGECRDALKGLDLVIHTAIVQIPLINEQKGLGFEVNFIGTQNVCRAVDESDSLKGLILTGTWHVFGEKEHHTVIDESFGFRPDKVESRARLYALSKISQEILVRYYDEMSSKIFGVIRLGTVLGEGMPEKTAANIFISKGIRGDALTPYKQSMYRPMLYVDINDVCEAFVKYAEKVLAGEIKKDRDGGLAHIVNLYWSQPLTIMDLAQIVKGEISRITDGKIEPKIDIVDTGTSVLYDESDKSKLVVDSSKIFDFLGIEKMTDPKDSVGRIVAKAMEKT